MRLTQYAPLFGLFLLISSCATTYNNTTDVLSYEGVHIPVNGALIFEPCDSTESWGVIVSPEYKAEFETTIASLHDEWLEQQKRLTGSGAALFPYYFLEVEAILSGLSWSHRQDNLRRRLRITKITEAHLATGDEQGRCVSKNWSRKFFGPRIIRRPNF